MYWKGHESFTVRDQASAAAWLNVLTDFLRLQRRAGKQRRWPNDEAWAHGGAAKYQNTAEGLAQKLGGEFLEDVKAKRLTAARESQGIIRVYRQGVLLYSVWRSPNRFVAHRQRCFCLAESDGKRRKSIRCCSARAQNAGALAEALLMWDIEEKQYWDVFKEICCCGTMDECPLKREHIKKSHVDEE
jgi:hypothetical protein